MDRERVLLDQTVVITAGRIAQIGPASEVRIPPEAVRIDGRGKYLLPGLADMHAHPFMGPHIGTEFSNGGFIQGKFSEIVAPWSDSADGEARLFLWLANGATTVRVVDYVGDHHGSSDRIGRLMLSLRARAMTNTEWLPHIHTAGQVAPRQYLWRSPGDPAPVLDSVAKYVATYKAAGYDFIKIHDEPADVLDSIMVAAKHVGVPVVGHVPTNVTVEHVLPYYTSIEHPLTEYTWTGHTAYSGDTIGLGVLAAAIARAGVWNCPTQSHYDHSHYDWFEDRPPGYLNVLHDAGVKLLLGTDEVPWNGVLTSELESMVAAGLTPYQALQTGTTNVAEYFGTTRESGTIAVGKRADLVLLTGNPLTDVRYTAQPAGVMLSGRWLSRAEIDERVATLRLPMSASTDSVQGYWSNVMRQALSGSAFVLHGMHWTETQTATVKALQVNHRKERAALLDSLGHSDQYGVNTERVYALIVRQLRDDRAIMTPEQTSAFDVQFSKWQQKN